MSSEEVRKFQVVADRLEKAAKAHAEHAKQVEFAERELSKHKASLKEKYGTSHPDKLRAKQAEAAEEVKKMIAKIEDALTSAGH